jgi:hypothetical protein
MAKNSTSRATEPDQDQDQITSQTVPRWTANGQGSDLYIRLQPAAPKALSPLTRRRARRVTASPVQGTATTRCDCRCQHLFRVADLSTTTLSRSTFSRHSTPGSVSRSDPCGLGEDAFHVVLPTALSAAVTVQTLDATDITGMVASCSLLVGGSTFMASGSGWRRSVTE